MYINSFQPINYAKYPYDGLQPINTPAYESYQQVTPAPSRELNTNFAGNYWQYQNYCALNNQVYFNQAFANNMQIGRNLVNDFNNQYPNLESYTMVDTLARKMEKANPNSPETLQMKTKSDILFKKMINLLDKRPNHKEVTFDEYLDIIKDEFKQENHGNCGERAYLIYDKLNKSGVKNHAVIEIGGDKNYNSHVFNVIGLSPNADISKPETWGETAVVVDTWANKCCSVKDALSFYYDFLEYSETNPMKFEKLDINKNFKQEN